MAEPARAELPEQLLDLPSRGVGDASSIIVEVGQQRGYTVGAVGPGAFRLERSLRPMWATVLAICLLPLLGLGLLFLRVRRNESSMITVFEDRTGTKARVVGTVDVELVVQLTAATQRQVPTVSAPPRATTDTRAAPGAIGVMPGTVRGRADPPPTTIAGPLLGHDSVPSADSGESISAASTKKVDVDATVTKAALQALSRSTESWWVSMPDGSKYDLTAAMVIGRQPSAEHGALLQAVADPSLSKSHVLLEPTERGVRVVDLYSTNGTTIRSGGIDAPCLPGVPRHIDDGDSVIAGEFTLRVGQHR